MKEFRDVLIRRLDDSFSAMVQANSEKEYQYEFGQFSAFLSMLFVGGMISFEEYNVLTDIKLSFYFSKTRNEVVFK